jgi:hypothetical protein
MVRPYDLGARTVADLQYELFSDISEVIPELSSNLSNNLSNRYRKVRLWHG